LENSSIIKDDCEYVPFSWPRDRGVRFKYLDRPNSLEVTGALREPHARNGELVSTVLDPPSFVFSSTFHQPREWFSIKELGLAEETKTKTNPMENKSTVINKSQRKANATYSGRYAALNLAEKPRHSCIREYARVGFCLVISGPSPAAERGPRSLGPPAFRLQGGLPSLDTTRSRTDTYTRPSACNHPPRSPSFPRMTFRLSCCAGPRLGGVSPRWDPMAGPKSVPFALSSRRRLHPTRIIIYNHYLKNPARMHNFVCSTRMSIS
ncbi:hypothetical protein ALC57_07140, partial [Trachymyrmex cornetzi]